MIGDKIADILGRQNNEDIINIINHFHLYNHSHIFVFWSNSTFIVFGARFKNIFVYNEYYAIPKFYEFYESVRF